MHSSKSFLFSALTFLTGIGAGVHLKLWQQLFAPLFGSDPITTSLALAALLLGAAAGAWLAAGLLARTGRPLGALSAFQLLLSLYSLALCFLLPYLGEALLGPWAAATPAPPLGRFLGFGTIYLTTLPATALLGACLVTVMDGLQVSEGMHRAAGLAFSSLLIGLACGLVAAALSPWGENAAAGAGAATLVLGLAAATGASISFLRHPAGEAPRRLEELVRRDQTNGQTLLLAGLAGAGVSLILFLLSRLTEYALAQSPFALPASGAAALGSLGLGNLAAAAFFKPSKPLRPWLGKTLVAGCFFAAAMANLFSHAIHHGYFQTEAPPPTEGLTVELAKALGIALFLLPVPAVLLGLILPILCGLAVERGRPAREAASGILAASALGGSVGLALYAPLVTFAGLQGGIVLGAFGLACAGVSMSADRRLYLIPLAVLLLFAFLEPPRLPLRWVPKELKISDYQESPEGTFAALADESGKIQQICLDGYRVLDGQESDAEILVAHLPLCLSQARRPILLLGFGPVAAAEIITAYPDSGRMLAWTPARATWRAMARILEDQMHSKMAPSEKASEKLEYAHGDLLSLLRGQPETWSLILASPAWQPGPQARARLASPSLLRLARHCLSDNGLFCLSIQATMPPGIFLSVLDSFTKEFPEGQIWMFEPHHVLLLGGKGNVQFSLSDLEENLARPEVDAALARLHVATVDALLGSRVCSASRWRERTKETLEKPPQASNLARLWAKAEAGDFSETWRQANLNKLADAVDPVPIPVEAPDNSLRVRLQLAADALKYMIRGLAQARSEYDLSASRELFQQGVSACPGDKRLEELLRRSASQPAPQPVLKPDAPVADWQVHLRRGDGAFDRRDYPRALLEYRKAEQLAPAKEETQFCVALALSRLGRHEEAIERFRAIWDSNPKRTEAGINLGFSLARLGKFPEAETCLRTVLDRSPQHEMAHYNLATVLKQMKRTEEAIAEFQAALQLRPEYPEAMYDLAILLYQEEEFFQALKLLKKFEPLSPQSVQAKEARRIIQELERKQPKR